MGRKEDTARRLKESFKQLVRIIPVEKITIQEIVEGAGVIRPTFYNHFQDKYELFDIDTVRDLRQCLNLAAARYSK